MATTDPQKKNRLSRLLGGSKREKSPDKPASFPPDSAYASSDVAVSAPDQSNEQIVPAEKNSEIANIDKDRNLGVKPSTGQVFDRDTGEVVTVVTTTTTTTTTTTRRPGKKSPDVHQDIQKMTQTQPATNANGTVDPTSDKSGIIAEMPATPAEQPKVHSTYPAGDTQNRIRDKSPSIPPKSANRKSGEFGTHSHYNPAPDVSPEGSYMARPGPTGNTPPLSPTGANYSYPSHTGRSDYDNVSLATTAQTQSHNKSTIADLKAAAKGLHGVGETLRGTLNSAVDENFPRKNAKKAAFAKSKNDATLARGREEVSSIPHRNRQQYDTPPTDSLYGSSQHIPQHHDNSHTYTSSAHPPPIPQAHNYGGAPVRPPSPTRTPTNDQTVPGSWGADDYDHGAYSGVGAGTPGGAGYGNAAGVGQENIEREKTRGSLGKLFKRKPVAAGQEQGNLKDRKYY